MNNTNSDFRYLTISAADEAWGSVVTTVGYQFIPPQGRYPFSGHPENYDFKPHTGRILNEYQLIYITKGSGYFSSRSCREQKVLAGTLILLFPDEWHSYFPDKETGWDEYWVGFRDVRMPELIQNNFFSKENPLCKIGLNTQVINLYEEIMLSASLEKPGYQQLISNIVLHMLGILYYNKKNGSFVNNPDIEKINQAQELMRKSIENPLPPQAIADELGLGYSWFRRLFKKYTGVSPVQYQLQLKLLRAKELMIHSSLTISEIAYELKFDSIAQFSTFFKKREGITPSEFRKRNH